jgi:hypothetical protein
MAAAQPSFGQGTAEHIGIEVHRRFERLLQKGTELNLRPAKVFSNEHTPFLGIDQTGDRDADSVELCGMEPLLLEVFLDSAN